MRCFFSLTLPEHMANIRQPATFYNYVDGLLAQFVWAQAA